MIFDSDEELNVVELENYTRLCRTYEATNRVQKSMIKGGHKAGNKSLKAVNKLKLRCPDPARRMSIISSSGGTSVLNIFLITLVIFAGYIFLSFCIDIVSFLI